ncbi:MAG: hypothetical protein QM726_00430 [Chitinophagaceae bacterium]
MEQQELISSINQEMNLQLAPQLSFEAMRLQLQAVINELIQKNFDQLINLLYRIDVNERKLKYFLQENVGEDAAVIIADLIIERQLQKIKSRAEFNDWLQNDEEISDEERW